MWEDSSRGPRLIREGGGDQRWRESVCVFIRAVFLAQGAHFLTALPEGLPECCGKGTLGRGCYKRLLNTFLTVWPHLGILPCSILGSSDLVTSAAAQQRKPLFGRGDDTVGNPHRAQIYQLELFQLFILLKVDKQLSIERFEPTVSQSTVSSPLLLVFCDGSPVSTVRPRQKRLRAWGISLSCSREGRHPPHGVDILSSSYMRNLLGWLRRGWRKIRYITLTYTKLLFDMLVFLYLLWHPVPHPVPYLLAAYDKSWWQQYIYVYIYIYTHTHIHYIYVYIYIYIYTYIHIIYR